VGETPHYFPQDEAPQGMGKDEVGQFLTYLAVTRRVAPSTQNQALHPILFLFREVLKADMQINPKSRDRRYRPGLFHK
jgi:hypothetical protein